jgi:hypothetical protein
MSGMSRYSFIALCAIAASAHAVGADIHRVNGALVAGAPCGDLSTVNGALEVGVGQSCGNVSTINGAIEIGDKASIGSAHTVNGHITLGAATTAQSLRTVNGAISVGPGAQVHGDAHTTNGAIHIASGTHLTGVVNTSNGKIVLEPSADIGGYVASVNGRIRLDAAHVGNGIESVSGDIDLGAHSRVEGGIWVKGTTGSCGSDLMREILRWLPLSSCEPQRVVIGPDAVVQGKLKFEHPVRLYVNASARIGAVEGAQPITFAGERPPI